MTEPTVEDVKFRLEQKCRMPGHGKRPTPPDFGLICHRHAADVRDLLADVADLLTAYAEGDTVQPEPGEHRGGKQPHPPIPIRINAFLIGNPGGDPVESETEMEQWLRYGNPSSGRLESNGPDSPDIRSVIYNWTDQLTTTIPALTWPAGDTMAKLGYLRANLADVTRLDGFSDFLRDLRNCRRALALAIGERPGPQPLGKCPDCNTDLFTDKDREVVRRRRMGEPVTGTEAAPYTVKANRVSCGCGAVWEGAGLARLRVILNHAEPGPRLQRTAQGNGWMVS